MPKPTPTAWREAALHAKTMRETQTRYFKTRDPKILELSKALERSFDKMVDELLAQENAPLSLFDEETDATL